MDDVQKHMVENYSQIINSNDDEENAIPYKNAIEQFIVSKGYSVAPYTTHELTERLYIEMAQYSFLSEYLDNLEKLGIEEINLNRFDDTKVSYSGGAVLPSKEQFKQPKYALDIIQRILRKSGIVLDNSIPAVVGYLSDRIRITAVCSDIIPSGAGISASIRIVNAKNLVREDFLNPEAQTATAEMLDFLSDAVRYNLSLCISGATGSGKTTIMSHLCNNIEHSDRVFVIENGTHEFELWKRNEFGEIVNNVIHTISRSHQEEKFRISQDRLLEIALTMNPDVIIVSEMKSAEALAAVEAANTGHAVFTTVHANSCLLTYGRIVDLCKKADNKADAETLYRQAYDAFPITVYVKKYKDNVRRISEIAECVTLPSGERVVKTLFRFKVIKQELIGDNTVINGKFERCENISEPLAQRLMSNGMPTDDIIRWSGRSVVE